MDLSPPQAARVCGCSRSQLDQWDRVGLVQPTDGPDGPRYAFADLVALRVIGGLLDAGLSLARIRRALDHVAAAGDDVAGLRLLTDGDHVWACRDDGEVLDVLRGGQLVLFVDVDRFAGDVEASVVAFDAERHAFLADLGAVGPGSPGAGSAQRVG